MPSQAEATGELLAPEHERERVGFLAQDLDLTLVPDDHPLPAQRGVAPWDQARGRGPPTNEAFLAAQNPGNTTNVRTGGSVVNYTAANCTTPAPLP